MKFHLDTRVAFAVDIPERRIKKGDLATIVEYFDLPSPGYALEVFNALDASIDVLSVPESSLEALRADQIIAVRKIKLPQ